jgi:hypothetical protein
MWIIKLKERSSDQLLTTHSNAHLQLTENHETRLHPSFSRAITRFGCNIFNWTKKVKELPPVLLPRMRRSQRTPAGILCGHDNDLFRCCIGDPDDAPRLSSEPHPTPRPCYACSQAERHTSASPRKSSDRRTPTPPMRWAMVEAVRRELVGEEAMNRSAAWLGQVLSTTAAHPPTCLGTHAKDPGATTRSAPTSNKATTRRRHHQGSAPTRYAAPASSPASTHERRCRWVHLAGIDESGNLGRGGGWTRRNQQPGTRPLARVEPELDHGGVN